MPRGPRALVPLAAFLVLGTLVALLLRGVLGGDDGDGRPVSGSAAARAVEADPFGAYRPELRGEYERRAAVAFAQPLLEKTPGGIVAGARRTVRFRALIEDAARRAEVDPDLIEGLVLLESAGRARARAGDGLEAATGLTQILGETGRTLLGMRIDRRQDDRLDPRKALRATARYLTFAKGKLGGREDLAFVSYHMGVGNLQTALRRNGGGGPVPYAQLALGGTAASAAFLQSLGDDSQTYLWRVQAAARLMALFRRGPEVLQAEADRRLAPLGPSGTARRTEDRPRLLQQIDAVVTGPPLSLVRAWDDGSFEVRRRYASGAQALAFQRALDRVRLLALGRYARVAGGERIRVVPLPEPPRP